jgi:hypothetical protein
MRIPALVIISVMSLVGAGATSAQPTHEGAIAEMRPYEGLSIRSSDRTTLHGKVMAGYQGWFTAEGDGAGMRWRHYSRRGQFRPGACNIDLWPDVSELDDDEKSATAFRHSDGQTAYVFSSHNRKTVLRHFQWMQEYGIDGVFVQRFVVETAQPLALRHCNTVLAHCRDGANQRGRCYAVMYDLSGLRAGGIDRAIADWKLLVDRMKLGRDERDQAYLFHGGKPIVAVWGVGFNDGRSYTLADCDRLVNFLKDDPDYGGNTVMLGIPTSWRTLDRDAVNDPELHDQHALCELPDVAHRVGSESDEELTDMRREGRLPLVRRRCGIALDQQLAEGDTDVLSIWESYLRALISE